jgi:hypothetical protein
MSSSSHQAIYSQEQSKRGAEVGSIPAPKNSERREACRLNLNRFLSAYFPETTGLSEFCDDQRNAIQRIENAMLNGGRVLNLFPRGFAKTTISENAAMWGTLYGHRRFVPIIGADEHAAKDNIESIKTELMTNDLLEEDFPEIVLPVKHLENKAQRCRSQTILGELSHMQWGQDTVVFPSSKDKSGKWYDNAGAIITARGLTGRIRGMAHKRPDGTKQRPDFVIIDDPQTDVSAMSPAQVVKRLNLIRKGALRLGGHTTQIAAVMNATCIIDDDVADQLADHKKHPEWEGIRIPMLKKDAKEHDSLWMEQYAEIRRTYNPEDPYDRSRAIRDSNKFYKKNRKAMDAGAVATWEQCFSPDDELSAIQHAYNIRIDDGEDVFASECQNRPIRMHGSAEWLNASQICNTRTGTWTRFPNDVDVVGFHIDVQKRLLFWTAVGVSQDWRVFAQYGTYPEQSRRVWEYRTVRKTIAKVHQGLSEEKTIEKALTELIQTLRERVWTRQDGVELRADIGLVDGGYQAAAVRQAIENAKASQNVFVTFGRGVRASDVPLLQRKKVRGEIRSNDAAIPWLIKPDATIRGKRNAFLDTNACKTFLHRRILTDAGMAGSFELPKGEHRQYAMNLAASEYSTATEGPYGHVLEWKLLPGAPDNHWFDTTVGACVAASISGKVSFNPMTSRPTQKAARKRVSYL